MAYNDQTVAINPDGDGNVVFYSDQNPTVNGQYIGGGFSFGADGARNGHATSQIIYGRHHVGSTNGYFVGDMDRMLDTSDTFNTTQVVNGSGQWVGNNVLVGGSSGSSLRIGIGTNSPISKLDIYGSHTGGYGIVNVTSTDNAILCLDAANGDARIRHKSNGQEKWFTGPWDSSYNYAIQNGSNSYYALFINFSTGNVGFNNTSPGERVSIGAGDKLAVYRGANDRRGLFYTDNSGTIIESDTTGNDPLFLKSPGTSGNIRFFAGSSQSAILNQTGLGIGTGSPSHKLHIYTGADSGGVAKFEGLAGNYWITGTDGSGSYIEVAGATSATKKIRIQGNKGDGTYTQLQIDAYNQKIYTTNSNFGIGQSTPLQRLAVAGNILLGDNDVSSFMHGGANVALSADINVLIVADSNSTTGSPDSDIIFGAGSNADTDGNRSFGFTDAYPSSTPRLEYMRIVGATGKVGLGVTSPSTSLHVKNSTGSAAIRADYNGTSSIDITASSTGNSFIESSDISSIRVGHVSSTKLFIDTHANGGKIGVGTMTPGSYKLNVNGTFYSAGSSLEYKENIEKYSPDTKKIMMLNPVTYDYKTEYKHLGKELQSGTQIGLIAEQVAEVFPELALLKEDEDGVIRVRNVDYEKLTIILLSEVQKLRNEINQLKFD